MKVQKTRIWADIKGEKAVIYFLGASVREMAEVQTIMDEIDEVAGNGKIEVVVLNFARIQQLTSAFLGRLIGLSKTLKQSGVSLRLCGMAPPVEEAFKICKLQKLIPLYPSEEKALEG